MISGGWRHFSGMNVLLLQGPVGPFFWRLSKQLSDAGARSIHKINLNAGDWLFFPHASINFTGRCSDWPAFLDRVLERHQIDAVLLFGDCRIYHSMATRLAEARSIEVWIFEEGYVRPDFVTMEREGTNGYSRLPRDPDFYRRLPEGTDVPEQQVGNVFPWLALWGALYFLAGSLGYVFFRYYHHHRRFSLLEGLLWLRAGWRKQVYRVLERGLTQQLTGAMSERFFLVSLQTATDSQIRVHSRFRSIEAFIHEIIASFSRHCPSPFTLVFKHHPLDRGHNDYSRVIRFLCSEYGIAGRVFYIHDQHLPTLLNHAVGLVVVNSTVGLSGIHHGLAVKALGAPVYDMEGLCWQGELDAFWREASSFKPDAALYRRFRRWLIEHTQLNGSFYAGNVESESRSASTHDHGSARPVPVSDHASPPVPDRSSDAAAGVAHEREAV